MTASDTAQDSTRVKEEFNQQLGALERGLQDKVSKLQEKAFFAEDSGSLKTEGILRAEAMEMAYQEFREQVHQLVKNTKAKMGAVDY